MSELVNSMQNLGFHDKNPMMFEMILKISAKRKGGGATFVQFAEDMAGLIVSTINSAHPSWSYWVIHEKLIAGYPSPDTCSYMLIGAW